MQVASVLYDVLDPAASNQCFQVDSVLCAEFMLQPSLIVRNAIVIACRYKEEADEMRTRHFGEVLITPTAQQVAVETYPGRVSLSVMLEFFPATNGKESFSQGLFIRQSLSASREENFGGLPGRIVRAKARGSAELAHRCHYLTKPRRQEERLPAYRSR